MAVPMLHETNKEEIQRMLGVPMRMKEIPPVVVERVLKAQQCIARLNQSTQLPAHTLLLLCYDQEVTPQPTKTKYGHLKEGTTVYFKVNEYEWQPCTFLAVADPQMHTYHIHIWGENRTAPENMLRESHPADVTEADIQAPAAEAKSEATTEEGRDEDLEAQRIADACDKLKEAFPKDTQVDVAIPGEAFFQGTVCGHGTPKNQPGKLQVRPSTETGKGFRWVAASNVTKTVDLVGA